MKVVALFDGSCLHGVDGAGAAVAYDVDGNELARRARYLPDPDVTVNVAEYMGLELALGLARDLGATEIEILGDSELIVRHYNGTYACRKEHLKPLLARVRTLAASFPRSCSIVVRELPKTYSGQNHNGRGSVPKLRRRNGNVEADALASECRRARRDIP